MGRRIEDVAARIEREVAALGGTRIITLGPSMGGYGAILFGCMLSAERAAGSLLAALESPQRSPQR